MERCACGEIALYKVGTQFFCKQHRYIAQVVCITETAFLDLKWGAYEASVTAAELHMDVMSNRNRKRAIHREK